MCIFRNLSRCTSTYQLAFRRVIYVWKYTFVICNHQAGGIWKYLFVRHISYFKTIFLLNFLFNFHFVDSISSLWRTSLMQSLQCKVAFQAVSYFSYWETWWDQFSKLLSVKTLTEKENKIYNSHHLMYKTPQKFRLSEEEKQACKQTNEKGFVK